jgi:hypothetical protein
VSIPAAEERFQELLHSRVEGAEIFREPFVPDSEKRLEVLLDDVLQGV